MADDRIAKLEARIDLLTRMVYLLSTHRHERGRVVADGEPDAQPAGTADDAIRSALVAALEQAHGSKAQAARILGVNVKTVFNWVRKYL